MAKDDFDITSLAQSAMYGPDYDNQEKLHKAFLLKYTQDEVNAYNHIQKTILSGITDTEERRRKSELMLEKLRKNTVDRMSSYELQQYRRVQAAELERKKDELKSEMEMRVAEIDRFYEVLTDKEDNTGQLIKEKRVKTAQEIAEEELQIRRKYNELIRDSYSQQAKDEANRHEQQHQKWIESRFLMDRKALDNALKGTEDAQKKEEEKKQKIKAKYDALEKKRQSSGLSKQEQKEYEKTKKQLDEKEKKLKEINEQKQHYVDLQKRENEGEGEALKAEKDLKEKQRLNSIQESDEANSLLGKLGLSKDGKLSLGALKDTETQDAIRDSMAQLTDRLVEGAANTLAQVETKVNTRLQGYNPVRSKSKAAGVGTVLEAIATGGASLFGEIGKESSPFRQIYDIIKYNVGISPLVQQTEVLKNLATLTDKGIAYNVESRAYLQTLSEGIANTFDAMQDQMLRLTRIQQADSTLYRLGLEASLTEMFNKYFQDTSYLTDSFKQVASSLLEASSKLGRNDSLEFEYMVQKWLGAMQSVGVSSNFVQSVGSAIGMLGSGDVYGLAGNVPMQNLIAISANRAGLNYAEMLTNGLNASKVNRLLEAMVGYLGDIADHTDMNNVVQKAYGGVLGLNVSDFQGVQNLVPMINSITRQTMSTSQMSQNVSRNVAQMFTRMSLSTMLNNILQNAEFAIGASTAANPFTYALYKGVSILDTVAGGLELPAVSVFGNMVDLHSLVSLIKAGLGGLGVISTMVQAITGASSLAGGIMSGNVLNGWNYIDTLEYGSGNIGTQAGSSLSRTQITGNASSGDMQEQSIKDSMKTSEEVNKQSGAEEMQKEKDIYDALVGNNNETALVTDIRTSTKETNIQIKSLESLQEKLMSHSNKESMNVNLKYISGLPVPITGVPVEVYGSNEFISKLVMMLGFNTLMKGIGGEEEEGNILAKAAEVIVNSKADDDSLSVTVKKNEQSLLDWLKQGKTI